MLKKLSTVLVCGLFFLIKPMIAFSDELKDVLIGFENVFSSEFKYSLEGKVAQDDFPRNLLDSILADLEKNLFEITDFQINLQLQNKLEKVWQDSIEFNNSTFEEVYSNSGFDQLILLELNPQVDAVELVLRVLNVSGDDIGTVIFSSGSSTIPVNWSAINVATVNADEIKNIRDELERLSANFSTIDAANTFAEHLHNARIHIGSQNLSAAIQSYQQAINIKSNYADILDEYYQVLIARFGSENATRYLEAQMFPNINDEIQLYFTLLYEDFTLRQLQRVLETHAVAYPPLLSRLVKDQLPRFENSIKLDNLLRSDRYLYDYLKLTSARELKKSYESTIIQKFFINPLAVQDSVNATKLVSIDRNLNRVEVVPFDISVPINSFNEAYVVPPLCSELQAFEQRFFEGTSDHYDFDSIGRLLTIKELLSSGKTTREYERYDDRTGNFQTIQKEVVLTATQKKLITKALNNCSNAAGLIYLRNNSLISLQNKIKFLNTTVCGGSQEFNVKDFNISPIINDEVFTLTSQKGEYLEFPLTIERDRYLFANVECEKESWSSENINTQNEGAEVPRKVLNGIGSVLITDDVDVTQPIIFNFIIDKKSSTDTVKSRQVDITKDGTFILQTGFPLNNVYIDGDWIHTNFDNNWLFIPGVVQSSLMFDRLSSVSYTTLSGENKLVENIRNQKDKHFSELQPYRGVLSLIGRNGFMLPGDIILDDVSTGSRLGMSNTLFGIKGLNSERSEIFSGKMRRNARGMCLGYGGLGTIEAWEDCFYSELAPGFFDEENGWKFVAYDDDQIVPVERIYGNCRTGQFWYFNTEYRHIGWGFGEYSAETQTFNTSFSSDPMNYYLDVENNRVISETYMATGWHTVDEIYSQLCPDRNARFATSDKFIPEVAPKCWINEQTARISNVQNYTNFRQRAGLNQPVLGQISLGETVTLTNPGSYLRTDRCASICNGSNQQSIKQCIDNNEVWIEVRYRGRVGYLSRKFVE